MRSGLLILLTFVYAAAFAQEPSSDSSAWVTAFLNKPAPKISLKTLDGIDYRLGEPQDKILVINFWFIACGPCRLEIPELNKLADSFKANRNIRFIAISTDQEEALRYVKERINMKYELVANAKSIVKLYQLELYPTNIVIDKNGSIVFAEVGLVKDIDAKLRQVIEGLLQNSTGN